MKPLLECGFYSHETVVEKVVLFILEKCVKWRELLSEVDHIQFPLFVVEPLIILTCKTCAEPAHGFLIYMSPYVSVLLYLDIIADLLAFLPAPQCLIIFLLCLLQIFPELRKR